MASTCAATERIIFSLDDWLIERQALFTPFEGHTRNDRFARRKAFAELTFFLRVADRLVTNPALDVLRERVVAFVNDDRFADLFARNGRLYDAYMPPVAYVDGLGRLSARMRGQARDLLSRSIVWFGESHAFHWIELLQWCKQFDVKGRSVQIEQVIPFTASANRPECLDMSAGDAYVLTHDVFLLTNFGAEQTTLLDRQHLRALLPLLVIRGIAAKNLDIALECAAAAVMIGVLPDAVSDLLLDAVTNEHDTHGTLRTLDSSGNFLPVGAEAPPALPLRSYHLNLVAAYALRLMAAERETAGRHALAIACDRSDLEILGHAVVALSRYQLVDGASWLDALSTSPLRSQWPTAIGELATFLARQLKPDGSYGFFVDESLDRQAAGFSGDAPSQETIARITESSERIVDRFRSEMQAWSDHSISLLER